MLKASRPKKNFINENPLYSVSYGGFYSQPLIQNTKKKKKSKSYYRGTKREENQKVRKVKRRRKGEQWQGQGNFAGCKNFAALLLFFLLLSASLLFLLLFASIFFWFLICNYELNLDSPWLSKIPIYGIKSLQNNKTCNKI